MAECYWCKKEIIEIPQTLPEWIRVFHETCLDEHIFEVLPDYAEAMGKPLRED